MPDAADVDAGEARFQPSVQQGQYGVYQLDAQGRWQFLLDVAKSATLPAGVQVLESFTVTSADGTKTVQTIAVKGLNDAAVLGGQTQGVLGETSAVPVSGRLTVTDVDAGEASYQPQSVETVYGRFTIDAQGQWSYVLKSGAAAVQALVQGQVLTERFSVNSLDGSSQVVSVSVTGVNNVAVVSGSAEATTTPTPLAILSAGAMSMPAMANSATGGALPTGVWLSSRPKRWPWRAGCKKRTRAPPGRVQPACRSGQLMACGAACWRVR